MPWALGGATLEGPALELGPGPGITTDYLRTRVSSLTVLEQDPILANRLLNRFHNTNVRVVKGDASAMPFERVLSAQFFVSPCCTTCRPHPCRIALWRK